MAAIVFTVHKRQLEVSPLERSHWERRTAGLGRRCALATLPPMLVLLLPGCHARTRALPATLSPANQSTSVGPWGDQRARQATIATILAKRALKPRRASVAELTERQSFYTTTELQYIPHEHPGKRRASRPEDVSMSRTVSYTHLTLPTKA